MGNWLVVGFIVAKRLPDHLELNQVEVVRLPREQVDKLPKGRPIPNHAPIEQLFGRGYSVTPPDLIVRSEWIARFWVESDDRDDAYRTVEASMVPALISALNSFPRAYPAHLEIVRVIELDANRNPIPGESATPFSLPSPFRGWDEPVGLDEAEVSALTNRFNALSSEPEAVSIGRDFGDAWRLDEISSGLAPLQEAALLSFFKVIEGISKSVVKTSEFPDTLEKQRQKLVDELRRALATGALRTQVRRIRAANTELQRLENAFLSQRIKVAGDTLELDPDRVKDAVSFARLRSRYLGHSGSELPRDERQKWFDGKRAAQSAIAYLSGYLEWLLAGKKPRSPSQRPVHRHSK